MHSIKLKVLIALLLCGFCLPALADGDIPAITDALQGLIDILTGTTAKLLAVVAIAGTGYLWLSGRLSLKHAAFICLGIGVTFGAPDIATALGAG